MYRPMLSLLSSLLLCSCVFVPVTAQKQTYYDKCKMATKKLTVQPKIRAKYSMCDEQALLQDVIPCLIGNGLVGSISFVVSGSIMVIGNTIHWMEYQSGCDPKINKYHNLGLAPENT